MSIINKYCITSSINLFVAIKLRYQHATVAESISKNINKVLKTEALKLSVNYI